MRVAHYLLGAALLALPSPVTAAAPEVRADGVGGITAETPFDAGRIAALFAGLPVAEAEEATEGEPYPVVRVGPAEAPLLTVVGDGRTIVSVLVHAGGPVGARFSDLHPHAVPSSCFVGTEERSGFVFCPMAAGPNLLARFAGSSDAPDDALPPRAQLRRWRVDQLVWLPPAAFLSDAEIAGHLVGNWSCVANCSDQELAFEAAGGFESWLHNRPSVVGGRWRVEDGTLWIECCGGAESGYGVRAADRDRVVMQEPGADGPTVLQRIPE